MTESINFHNARADDILLLARIRATLERMEDTIVFRLIDRAQYAHNEVVYRPGAFSELREKENWTGSWVEWFLKETESSHAKLGRWIAPDEYPFTPLEQLPPPLLEPVDYPQILHPHHVNVSREILAFYTSTIVPRITEGQGLEPDDRQYGSSAALDVEALSALSRRIYFGIFVSESKFRAAPAAFIPPIRARNTDELLRLVTNAAVEGKLLERVEQKALVYGQNLDGNNSHAAAHKIKAQEVVHLYKEYIIPLTKEVEVAYLLERLDGLSDEQLARLQA